MWWSERTGRTARLVAAAVLVAMTAAACGFEPLYAERSAGDVDDELAQVKIQIIPGRVGQQVHNYLLDRINRKGRPADPAYLLSVSLKVSTVRLGIERDEKATRAKLIILADVRLQDIASEEILLERSARSTNSYNIVDSAVATASAKLDAIDRAARDVSEEIRLLLALFFRRHTAQAASG